MKVINRFIAIVFLLFVSTSCFAATEELVIKYNSKQDGREVEVVVNQYGNVMLQMLEKSSQAGVDAEFLEKEVGAMVSITGKKTKLPNGYVLNYAGGYPIWGPSHMVHGKRELICLVFAEDARVVGKVIYSRGTNEAPPYYPYKLEGIKPEVCAKNLKLVDALISHSMAMGDAYQDLILKKADLERAVSLIAQSECEQVMKKRYEDLPALRKEKAELEKKLGEKFN